jgi:predicted transposase/invertase (TIGR01784 family)
MQMCWTNTFPNRIVFNAAKAYVRQLDKGNDYDLLQPVYGLCITDGTFDNKTPEFYHHYQTVNRKNTDEVIKGLEFVLVELPKFTPAKWDGRKKAVLWLRFLNEVGEKTTAVAPELLADDDIRKAVTLCEEGAFTPEEMAVYEKYWDIVSTEKALISGSIKIGTKIGRSEGVEEGTEKGIKIGRAEGIEIGVEKGRAEGIEIGVEKGRAEGKAETIREMALHAVRTGFSVEQVKALTGLAEEEIREIMRTA